MLTHLLSTSKPSLKMLDCGRAIQNYVDIDTYYCKPEISWRYINKTMFYTRFLSPTEYKCAQSSTYWQFSYYRPPGKFRWTSVNHFDKQREISLKCDAKNIYVSLSIYMYIYHTLDNRYGFAISIGNTKNHVATLTCLEWHTENMFTFPSKTSVEYWWSNTTVLMHVSFFYMWVTTSVVQARMYWLLLEILGIVLILMP